jgi:hypothetical protein
MFVVIMREPHTGISFLPSDNSFTPTPISDAGAGANTSTPVHTPTAGTYAGNSFEVAYLQIPAVVQLLTYDGREAAKGLTSSGATQANAAKSGSYTMESQRNGVYAVEGGIASNDPALIDTGLKAYEWGFAQMAADGSFPLERADSAQEMKYEHIHPISFFVESAAHSVLLIRAAPVDQQYKARAEALIPKIHRAAQYMNHQDNLDAFYAQGIDTNMLTTPAAAFQEVATLTGDTTLEAQAKWMMGKVLARQEADGTLPEKMGKPSGDFDTTYQSVSLEYLTRYASLLSDSSWKATVVAAIKRGTDEFLSKVSANGMIDTSTNSRTIACGARLTTPGPKGRNIDVIPLRLYYIGLFFGDASMYGPIADKIDAYGQGFDHGDQCTTAADVSE